MEQLTQRAIDFARQTDLLHSFADCGPYTVAGFTYTASVGGTDPRRAAQVLVVSGRAGAAWVPVATSESSWGAVKAQHQGVSGPDC